MPRWCSKYYTFGYDNISRLLSASYGDETVSYTYDNTGNRLTLNSSVYGLTSFTIASNSNQLTYRSKVPEDNDFTNMSYTYDAEGNLTQRGSGNNYDSLSFQSFGCALKQIQKVRGGSVQETISYGYDGMGQRVKMTDSQGTQYFLYDGLMPVLELDAGKNTTASYVYGANGVIYRRKHLPGDDEYEYHHVNALGSVAIITDDNESVAARYEYDAFGAVRHQWGNSDNIRKFTGKEYDADVKLYYYGARYYDPYIGRFISRDPAADGINWYVYCANNPLALVDPTGLEKIGDTRPVNDTEKEILRIVFGDWNAQILANEILIQKVTKDELVDIEAGAYIVGNIIHVAEDYDPGEPNFSGAVDAWIFTHEATHVWQHLTGYDKGGTGDYYYDRKQLLTLDLKNDEQAMAVADWAFIVWGFYHCGFTIDGSTQYILRYNITYRVIRSLPGHFNNIFHTDVRSMSFATNTVFHWYRRLIKQVRQPINWLGQNFPNPAT